jgi:hypothetical protein
MREFSASHCSQALYQGTTLVGPLKATTMRALALRCLLSCRMQRFSAALLVGPKALKENWAFRLQKNSCFVSGHDFSRAVRVRHSYEGFSHWAFFIAR